MLTAIALEMSYVGPFNEINVLLLFPSKTNRKVEIF